MSTQIQNDAKKRMQKSIEALQTELTKLRTGRAHPSLLDHISISYYNVDTPLSQVANINVLDARTLQITPWEKKNIPAIEKAIMTSDLGLNPATSGNLIRIPLAPLNEERRREMTKVVRGEGENAKVAIRNIRRDANNHLKELVKSKAISEDDERRSQEHIQKLTDQNIQEVDKIVSKKESELMEV